MFKIPQFTDIPSSEVTDSINELIVDLNGIFNSLAVASPLTASMGITRAGISALTDAQVPPTIVVSGSVAGGDYGSGATYTKVGATPGGLRAIQNLSGTWYNLVVDGPISSGWFDVKGDGTDDTANIQTFVNYIVGNSLHGFFLSTAAAGYYSISSAITIPSGNGWKLEGASLGGLSGAGGVRFVQQTDNTPILNFNVGNNWGWEISHFVFDWKNSQASSKTASVGIYFNASNVSFYNFKISWCFFNNGFRGIALNPSVTASPVWGFQIEKCFLSSTMTGALVYLSCTNEVGQPRMLIRDCYLRCDAQTEPSIYITAFDCIVLDGIEFNLGSYGVNSPQMFLSGGNMATLIGCKTEAVTVTAADWIWKFDGANQVVNIIGCSVDSLILTGGFCGLVAAFSGCVLNIMGLTCGVGQGCGNNLVAWPYACDGLSQIGWVSGITIAGAVNGTNFTRDLAGTGYYTTMPIFDITKLPLEFGLGVQHAYTTNSSTSATTTLAAADIFGGSEEHTLSLTGAITNPSNAALPTVTSLVTAINAAVGSVTVGQTWKLIIRGGNTGASAVWTITNAADSSWTINGTPTIAAYSAPNFGYREFYATLNSLTTATLQVIRAGVCIA